MGLTLEVEFCLLAVAFDLVLLVAGITAAIVVTFGVHGLASAVYSSFVANCIDRNGIFLVDLILVLSVDSTCVSRSWFWEL